MRGFDPRIHRVKNSFKLMGQACSIAVILRSALLRASRRMHGPAGGRRPFETRYALLSVTMMGRMARPKKQIGGP